MKTALAALAILFLSGCASLDDFKEFKKEGDTIYIEANVDKIKDSAVKALAETRLSVREVSYSDGGIVIYAEQSAVTGMIFNSYGGYGKVTIRKNAELGDKVYAVSALTRSKAVHEPVGVTDGAKGWNYNNPAVARKIIERIKELSYEK